MKPKSTLYVLVALLVAAAVTLGCVRYASAAPAGKTFTVNITSDVVDKTPGNGVCETDTGNGLCSLRAAVMEANAYLGQDTIVVPAETYTLTLSGINEDNAATGDLDITSSVTISGAGAGSTTIQWGQFVPDSSRDRIFSIHANITVSISGLTLRHGYVNGQPGGAGLLLYDSVLTLNDTAFADNFAPAFGGGIESLYGDLTVLNSTFTANRAGGGGGIMSFGSLALTNSTLTGNIAYDYGGGVQIYNGTGTFTNDTFSGNYGTHGGGIASEGAITVRDTTINGNYATSADGGGIYNTRALTVINSTISGNQAKRHGGGIGNYSGYSDAGMYLYNTTLTGNLADSDHDNDGNGGGVWILSNTPAQIANSILAQNTDGSPLAPFSQPHDCAGAVTTLGYNLLSNATGCTGFTPNQNGDRVGTYYFPVNPLLGALTNNGGATQTRALLPGSPALDAGNMNGCADGQGSMLATDQRGLPRLAGGRCDMGAYEAAANFQVYVPLTIK